MQTGTKISAAGHGALVALALFGVPWFGPREREAIRVTEVSFVSEAEFAAAQSAAPAEAPRAPDAPPTQPVARPEPEAETPDPPAEAAESPPETPEQAIAALDPPDAAPDRITPRIVTLQPPTAALPPRARPVQRVAPEPTPAPPEDVRPAETPEPAEAPTPEPQQVERTETTPAAPPEASPEPAAEPAPPATLALETSSRPVARPERVERRDPQAESVMTALRREVEREVARRSAEATPATEPTVTRPTEPTEPVASSATSLPVGPPLTGSEKDGLRVAVQRCWNVPAGLRDAQELKVTLAAELSANGEVINASIRLIEPSPAPDGRFQQAYEAGRRALIRCAPYGDLPRDKYAQWRNIEVVFNPEGMVSW